MERPLMNKLRKIIIVILLAYFSFYNLGCSPKKEGVKEERPEQEVAEEQAEAVEETKPLDRKEQMKVYMSELNPVLINVQITSRRMSQSMIQVEGAIKEMQSHVDSINSLSPPDFMSKQHNMILSSLESFKKGFDELNAGNRDASVELVTQGRDLLQAAVKDILELGRKEGVIGEAVEK